jgi:hypothetical protein
VIKSLLRISGKCTVSTELSFAVLDVNWQAREARVQVIKADGSGTSSCRCRQSCVTGRGHRPAAVPGCVISTDGPDAKVCACVGLGVTALMWHW